MNAGNNILISTAYLLLSYESSAKNNWINNMSPKKKIPYYSSLNSCGSDSCLIQPILAHYYVTYSSLNGQYHATNKVILIYFGFWNLKTCHSKFLSTNLSTKDYLFTYLFITIFLPSSTRFPRINLIENKIKI